MENEEYYSAAQRVKQFIKENNYKISVDKEIISSQLIEFREDFSPSRLQELSDNDLLNIIPLGKGEQNNLCHALEFKYNEYFGSIKGGAAFKFGLFWSSSREKWMTGSNKSPNELTDEEANNLCKEFRDSIVKVANLIENIKPDSVEKYIELENNIMQLLPQQLYNAMWVHKYFSMIYPEYFSNFHSKKWQETVLNRLGIEPKATKYVRSGQIAMIEKLTGLYRGEFSDVIYNMVKNADIEMNTNINNFDKNIILYGPPGTGKTYKSARYAVAICDNLSLEEVKAWDYSDVMKRYNELKKSSRINFVTFHQSYGYEEFIEGISPILDDSVDSSDVSYTIKDGVFKQFCKQAINRCEDVKSGDNYVFIIDEINRGNISKIFGELITLIEPSKRAGMEEAVSVKLPYSRKFFSVPSNVYILGTMNTADRSIAMMDTALRRRFNFIEMMPKSGELEGIEVEGVNIKNLLDAMNNRIEVLYDREHTLGHAFFMGLDSDSTINDLKNIFKNKIIPLLQEYFYEDYEKIQLVLGDNAKEDKFKFILDKKLDIKSIFKGNPNEVLDDEAKQYVINDDAFDRIESYQQIY